MRLRDHPPIAGHPIFAAVYDRMLAASERAGLAERRAELLAAATGRVLELGAGTGANLGHYPPHLEELVLAEPDPHMARRLRERVAGAPPPFRHSLVDASAERLPFPDGHFDAVVSTLVLCSVADPGAAAMEIARILRPGGRLLVIEHVRADSARLGRWQDRLERPWGWLAGGCHPNRDTAATLAAAGFGLDGVADETLPAGAPLVRPVIAGSASPPDG